MDIDEKEERKCISLRKRNEANNIRENREGSRWEERRPAKESGT